MVKWGKPYLPKIALGFLILGIIGAGYSYYVSENMMSKTQYGDNNSPTQTPNANYRNYELTNLACNTVFAAPSGSWANYQRMEIQIFSTGAYVLTWNAVYKPINCILPTTTAPNQILKVVMEYSTARNRFEVVYVGQES
jgi:hypothetical protein